MPRRPAAYMMANRFNGTIYTGSTIDLVRRVWQHRTGVGAALTREYGIRRLVWYELHETIEAARTRERRLKKWRRDWKLELIQRDNPDWRDLWPFVSGEI